MTSAALTSPAQASLDLDPQQAATLLRQARNALHPGVHPGAAEAVDWAHAALPDSRAARRLKIDALLAAGDTPAADALIALGLLARPTDPGLSLHAAYSLFLQRRYDEADRTIRLVLPRRARHTRTLALAGRIAAALGQHDRAVTILQHAHRHRPERQDIAGWLIESLLATECVEQAAVVVKTFSSPPAIWSARVMQAQGMPHQGIALLDAHLAREADPNLRDDMLVLLIEMLEADGDHPRLRRLSGRISSSTPNALIRLSRSLLSQGLFERVLEELQTLTPVDLRAPATCEIILVAASMLGRMDISRRALLDLEQTPGRDAVSGGAVSGGGGTGRRSLTDCWRRALLGRLLRDQHSSAQASADSNPAVLFALTRKALNVFDRHCDQVPLESTSHGTLECNRATCRALLGDSPLMTNARAIQSSI